MGRGRGKLWRAGMHQLYTHRKTIVQYIRINQARQFSNINLEIRHDLGIDFMSGLDE